MGAVVLVAHSNARARFSPRRNGEGLDGVSRHRPQLRSVRSRDAGVVGDDDFRGAHDMYQERYASREAALAGHAKALDLATSELPQ